MDAVTIVVSVCVLLLLAYVFDLTAAKSKIPSVVLLIALGWVVGQTQVVDFPDLSAVLPILGTVGLILIVLEGALELEVNRSKLPLVMKSSLVGLLPMLILVVASAYVARAFGYPSLKDNMTSFLPLFVISSAIAIPSASALATPQREFITYESSLSDIFGVMLFSFVSLNEVIDATAFGAFVWQFVLILVVSLVATLGLSYLLSRINHHVKFMPIVLAVILIYGMSKHYHLPSLVFILLFGLFLGNVGHSKRLFLQFLRPTELMDEVHKFKDVVSEFAFVMRALFFLLFGFLIDTNELLNLDTMRLAVLITVGIFAVRALVLYVFRLPVMPLVVVAPRGLITILLFLSIPTTQMIPLVNKSLIIQVIILTALVMMFGLVFYKAPKQDAPTPNT